ncbi:6-pyruvoyl tetrahydrobiopterin synthase [Sergentomyia squamirostris]
MSSAPVVYITRQEQVSTGHRLYSSQLTDEENLKVYGKCNNLHGHNYTVEVTIRGAVNPTTGMVMSIRDLKEYMDKAVMKKLDHKNLDKDLEAFREIPSTEENLSIFIWKELREVLPKPELLYEVRIAGTNKNFVIYRGD